ncbi:hypothetical protein K0M31_006425 [Melipona bicolor]|uniref:Uncharacterized protein n=1 Tax=Melipona bicolor TaxID=60889 RepID=A0AA40FU88_9HYME|nr:hypothetical protein K0M31_006425 [Melipona bicolor]
MLSIKSSVTTALLLAVYRSRGSFCFVLRLRAFSLRSEELKAPGKARSRHRPGIAESREHNGFSNLTFLDSCNDTATSWIFPDDLDVGRETTSYQLPVTIDPGSSTKASINLASQTRRTAKPSQTESGRGILNISLIVRFSLARWFPICDWSGADDGGGHSSVKT